MNDQFATAMGRALEETRAGNPAQATHILQAALGGQGSEQATPLPPRSSAAARGRQPLGRVIDSLVNGKVLRGPAINRPAIKPAVPAGAAYEARRHGSAHGARDYRIFIPSDRSGPPQGLILMLHGCTQSANDFAVGTQMNLHAERHRLIVVYPEQVRTANQMGCWNWFRPEDQRRGQGEPAFLAELALNAATEFGVAEGRIFAAGLSAGGAMAAILGHAYPDVFAAVGVHSGLAPGSAGDVAGAFAAMRGATVLSPAVAANPVPSIVFHGTADTTVAPSNAAAVVAAATGVTPTVQIDEGATAGAKVTLYRDTSGRALVENWLLEDVGHAWSGGAPDGSYTHPGGPDASAEMVRFFLSLQTEGRR